MQVIFAYSLGLAIPRCPPGCGQGMEIRYQSPNHDLGLAVVYALMFISPEIQELRQKHVL